MWDAFGALLDGMVNVGLNPTPNIDLQALLDPIKEQCPILRYLQGMKFRNKSATYEMVPKLSCSDEDPWKKSGCAHL